MYTLSLAAACFVTDTAYPTYGVYGVRLRMHTAKAEILWSLFRYAEIMVHCLYHTYQPLLDTDNRRIYTLAGAVSVS